MDHGFSNSLPIRTWKKILLSYVALTLLTFSTSLVINVFLSPKSCNEDQFPMLSNMDGNVKTIVACLICITFVYILYLIFDEATIIDEVATFAFCYGSWYLGYIAIQEYVFQDMGKDCMDGLSQNLLKHQSFAWFAFTMGIIEMLVRFLIKFLFKMIKCCFKIIKCCLKLIGTYIWKTLYVK